MLDILQRLEEMLRKYGHFGQANHLAKIAESRRQEAITEFQRAVTGNGVWGGAGSVSDISIAAAVRDVTPEVRSDERQFRADVITLAEELEKEALGTPRSRFIANVFRDWNAGAI